MTLPFRVQSNYNQGGESPTAAPLLNLATFQPTVRGMQLAANCPIRVDNNYRESLVASSNPCDWRRGRSNTSKPWSSSTKAHLPSQYTNDG